MSEAVREQAKRALARSAIAADVKRGGQVGRPIPIAHPDGELYGWFVPVSVGEQIAGFMRFLADLTLLGYSEFPASARASLASWTDAETIRGQAEAFLKQRGKAGNPVLTYDGAPSRIAWMKLV